MSAVGKYSIPANGEASTAGFSPCRFGIAVVTASAIARLQVKREMTQSYLQIFDRADTAFAWLTQDAPILA